MPEHTQGYNRHDILKLRAAFPRHAALYAVYLKIALKIMPFTTKWCKGWIANLRIFFYCVYGGLCYFCQQFSSRVLHSTGNVRASLSILRETVEKPRIGIKFKVAETYHTRNFGYVFKFNFFEKVSISRFFRLILQNCYWHL